MTKHIYIVKFTHETGAKTINVSVNSESEAGAIEDAMDLLASKRDCAHEYDPEILAKIETWYHKTTSPDYVVHHANGFKVCGSIYSARTWIKENL